MPTSAAPSAPEGFTVVDDNNDNQQWLTSLEVHMAAEQAATQQHLDGEAPPAPPTETESKTIVVEGRDGRLLTRREPQAKAKPSAVVKKYYVVYHAPNHPKCLGIYHATWDCFADILPNKRLCGSGCSLAGFYTYREAEEKWHTAGWQSEAPFQDIPVPEEHLST